MTAAMERRLARLEARRPSERPWRDPYDACMRLWAALQAVQAAERAGRPFSRLPKPELSPEAEEQVALAMRDADRMHERLRAERQGA